MTRGERRRRNGMEATRRKTDRRYEPADERGES